MAESGRELVEAEAEAGDLSVTALYTCETWRWGGLEGAELLATDESRVVFRVTNWFIAVARWFARGYRSLRHGLVHRHVMIDHLVAEARPEHVLELAAGLSRRGVALSARPELGYTEVDLPPMVAKKRELLGRTEAGRQVLARHNLRLIGGDATKLPLGELVPAEARLVVVSEGLLIYLDAEAQRALWSDVARLLSGRPGGAYIFDLVPPAEEPAPGLVGRLAGWLFRRFTKGRGFAPDARTREDILGELREAGFASAQAFEPADVAAAWGLPHPEVPTRQVVFACRVDPAPGRSGVTAD